MDSVQISNTLKRICYFRDIIKEKMTVSTERIQNVLGIEMGYKSGKNFPDLKNFTPFHASDRWSFENDAHFLFYLEFKTPLVEEDERCELRVLTDNDKRNPQFIVYKNGKALQGIDNEHKNVVVSSGRKHAIYVYAYGGALVDESYSFNPVLAVVNKQIEQLFYDIEVALQWLEITESKYSVYYDVLFALNDAINLIDFLTEDKEEFMISVRRAREFLQGNFFANKALESTPNGCVHAIGHSHIDLMWLWPMKQAAEKIQHTTASMLPLLKEYPEYSFFCSQPALYELLKKEDLDLYHGVKAKVASGQWEPDGGAWVENDCNIPSGESLVRQFLYGKEYFKDEFGIDSKIAWFPDSFGFTASLPQILDKCGMEVMVTSKLSWGEANIMPNDLFLWRGIDGTQKLTYFLTTQEFPMYKDLVNYTVYSGQIKPSQVKGCYNRFRNKEIYKKTLMPFGFGDGGGGANRLQLEMAKRMAKVLPEMPQLKLDRADSFFQELIQNVDYDKLPKWEGELYLELHRGTFTSQAEIKKCNRTHEFLLQKAELFSVIGEHLTAEPYPKKELKNNWKKLLTNQFHDLLSGTCIEQANTTAKKDYTDIYCEIAPLYYNVMEKIAAQIQGDGNVVFNPTSFALDATVHMGEEYRFIKNIPPKGYAVREVEPLNDSIKLGENTIENEYFILSFNSAGEINRLYDKRRNRELLKDGRKLDFSAFEDKPYDFDAWELKKYIYEKPYPIVFEKMTPFKKGCISGFEVRKKVGESTIVQKIYLFENQPMIEFETYIDWKEHNKVLKANFPLDINAQKVINEIPFGYIQRELHDNTTWEQARFEVCMHKYLDISESDYGVAILNDCKYGYGIINREINLTLLKSPTYPDPTSDQGEHYFRYALYVHDAGFDNSDVQKQAALYNNPLYVSIPPLNRQKVFPSEFSFVKSDSDNIVVDTVKRAEKGEGYIVRLYETKNTRTSFSLHFGIPVAAAVLCDMLENESEKLAVDGRIVHLTAKPFEIITLKIKKF